MIGVKPATEYTFPHTQEPETWRLSHPENWDAKNLSQNFVNPKHRGEIANSVEVPHTDYWSDIAHEYDYESEDLDLQPETFESQHFRKKGPLFIWLITGTIPLWWFALELFYQEWPDEDNWRQQRAPPLEWPDDEDTADYDTYVNWHHQVYYDLHDAGIVKDPYFEIKDGKKIYTKWSGVTAPMEVI